MGTDIRLFVERRAQGRWEPVDLELHDNRNYALFAILADVRNGFGFAGIDSGDPLVPVSLPRGMPEDASPEIRRLGGGAHSHGWLTLEEILAFDWKQLGTRRGMVSAAGYFEWMCTGPGSGGPPSGTAGWMAGTELPETELRARIEEVTAGHDTVEAREDAVRAELSDLVCRVEWQEPYHRLAGFFWSEDIPRLKRLGEPADVRIVFYFDD